MKLRVIAAVMTVMLIISVAVFAANTKGQAGCKFAGKRIARQLGLSQDQIDQIKPIMQKFRADVKTLRESNVSRDQKKAQLKELRAQLKASIMPILTPEQQKKAEALWAKQGRRANFRKVLVKLSLTDEQKSTIKGIRQDARTQAKSIKSNQSLDDAAKKAELKQLRKDTREKILSVLTSDQRAQLESMKKNHTKA